MQGFQGASLAYFAHLIFIFARSNAAIWIIELVSGKRVAQRVKTAVKNGIVTAEKTTARKRKRKTVNY